MQSKTKAKVWKTTPPMRVMTRALFLALVLALTTIVSTSPVGAAESGDFVCSVNAGQNGTATVTWTDAGISEYHVRENGAYKATINGLTYLGKQGASYEVIAWIAGDKLTANCGETNPPPPPADLTCTIDNNAKITWNQVGPAGQKYQVLADGKWKTSTTALMYQGQAGIEYEVRAYLNGKRITDNCGETNPPPPPPADLTCTIDNNAKITWNQVGPAGQKYRILANGTFTTSTTALMYQGQAGIEYKVRANVNGSDLVGDCGSIPPPPPSRFCATIVGNATVSEGSSSAFKIRTEEAVSADTVFTINVYNGSATRVDRDDFQANGQDIIYGGYYTQFINRPTLSRIYGRIPNGHAYEGPQNDHAAVGPNGQPIWDYTVLKNGAVQFGGRVTVLIRAGQTMSDSFDIKAFQERILVDVSDNPGGDGFRGEGNENLNVRITSATGSDNDEICLTTGPTVTIYDRDSTVITPIAFDLNGDGKIGVTGSTSSSDKSGVTLGRTVQFDIDADGTLDTIEWFDGSGDGILVDTAEIGAENSINGRALFGDQGGIYANGYNKLAARDTNGDGQLSGSELTSLALWVDDGDAILEPGELKNLHEYEIRTISVSFKMVRDIDGRHLMRSVATTLDGSDILSEDVWFMTAN